MEKFELVSTVLPSLQHHYPNNFGLFCAVSWPAGRLPMEQQGDPLDLENWYNPLREFTFETSFPLLLSPRRPRLRREPAARLSWKKIWWRRRSDCALLRPSVRGSRAARATTCSTRCLRERRKCARAFNAMTKTMIGLNEKHFKIKDRS